MIDLPRTAVLLLVIVLGSWPAGAAATNQPPDEIAALIEELGASDYPRREAATRTLIRHGSPLVERLQAEILTADDAEVRHRLQYVLSNITPPKFAVLLISGDPASGLRPGDVITHVTNRPVRNTLELRQRLGAASFGLMLRVRRRDGTHELGPLEAGQLHEITDYVAPRGEACAEILRDFHAGLAERALAALRDLEADAPVREDELPAALRACLLFTAGQATAARGLLQGFERLAQPINGNQPWESLSGLDRLLGRKAPYQLEWELFTEAGQDFQRSSVDWDLRMQRILEPAGRYQETALRALQIWRADLRDSVATDRTQQHVAGNMLAVAGWMLYDLGLRSECCQLIEPRSILLRRGSGNPRKWVRVDTDAWLPYLRGDTQAAVDEFYEYAYAVLADPPRPGDDLFVIQNPIVAARIAFFLYQLPEDGRIDELAAQVIREQHPILPEYLRWMLHALRFENQKIIRRDLQAALPLLTRQAGVTAARDVALLEYVQENPQREIFLAALEQLRQATAGTERDEWLAIASALERLVAAAPDEAEQTLAPYADRPLVRALYHTARYHAAPPPAAALRDLLQAPLLAVPLDADDAAWLLLTRQRRLVHFETASERITPIDAPTADWFPNPRTWPWIGTGGDDGRAWVYGQRRLVEIRPDATPGVRLNITPEQVPILEPLLQSGFDELVDLVQSLPPRDDPRAGEFLAEQVQAHHGMVSDPSLPEISLVRRLARDPRIAQIVLRGGRQLLLLPEQRQVFASNWLADELGVQHLAFFAQAEPPTGQAAPRIWLFSNHGLLHLDTAVGTLERIALPGDEPYPPVIPESVPYVRTDPDLLYCARLPAHGGQVFRVRLKDRDVTALDLVNLALPPEYFPSLSRADIRAAMDRQLADSGQPPLAQIITDADQVIRSLVSDRTE